jgi:uncharacterized protein (TIGR02145 family)
MEFQVKLIDRNNKRFFANLLFLLLIGLFLGFAGGCKKDEDKEDNQNITVNSFSDPRDGNIYKTVKIGNQLWMAENLRYLPDVSHPIVGINSLPFHYVYFYFGKETYNGYSTDIVEAKATDHYANYGVLYNWQAALNSCPPGWHLPTDEAWKELTHFLGGDSIAGAKLRNRELSLWGDPLTGPDTTSSNVSGFSAIPGGRRNPGGTFGGMGMFSYFWSSADKPVGNAWDGNAWYMMLINNDSIAHIHNYAGKQYGFSVRCLKNE